MKQIFLFKYRKSKEYSEYSLDKNDVAQGNDIMQMGYITGMNTWQTS